VECSLLQLKGNGKNWETVQAAPVEDGLEEEGMEFEFSDDDAEAVFQKLNAGAAGGPHSRVAGAAVERTSQPVSRCFPHPPMLPHNARVFDLLGKGGHM